MYKYVTNVSNLYHNVILSFLEDKNIAIDGTLGNGHDADFLAEHFKKLYCFDIQSSAVENYKERCMSNTEVILDSHENFKKYIFEDVDCIVYNLGYLPGENKHITTKAESTLNSIEVGLSILKPNGLMIVALYSGHEEGKLEKDKVLEYVKSLPKNRYGVILQEFINRDNNPPALVIIEKK